MQMHITQPTIIALDWIVQEMWITDCFGLITELKILPFPSDTDLGTGCHAQWGRSTAMPRPDAQHSTAQSRSTCLWHGKMGWVSATVVRWRVAWERVLHLPPDLHLLFRWIYMVSQVSATGNLKLAVVQFLGWDWQSIPVPVPHGSWTGTGEWAWAVIDNQPNQEFCIISMGQLDNSWKSVT